MYGFWRLVCLACSVFCCIFAFQVSVVNAAVAGASVFRVIHTTGQKRVSGGGIKVDYVVQSTVEHSHIPRHKVISVDYTPADLAALFNSLKGRNPGAVAVTAGAAGAAALGGWVIDELTGQIMEPKEVPADYTLDGHFFTTGGGDLPNKSMSAHESCSLYQGGAITEFRPSTNSQSSYYCKGANGTISTIPRDCRLIPSFCLENKTPTVIRNEPVDQSEIDEKVKDWLKTAPWSVLDDLLHNPDGSPVESEKVKNKVKDWLKDVADSSPDLEFSPPDSIIINSPDGSTVRVPYAPAPEPSATTEDNPAPAANTLPDFCSWATVICDWLEWTKEEPEDMEPEELPVEEINLVDLKKDYNSGLGGGSCPAPVSFSYGGESMQFEYSDACWAARNVFRPVLLTLAGIIAAFIIIGASRRAV